MTDWAGFARCVIAPFRIVVYVPAPETETARKLSTLSRIQDAEPVPG